MSAESSPPSGNVTLMFTDIADSSVMNKALGDTVYRASLLEPHHQRLRDVIAAHNGFEVKTIGDSFMVAFSSPEDAIDCAERMQQRLDAPSPLNVIDTAGREWTVAIRIGIHAAQEILTPVLDKDRWDYYGGDVNFAARVESLAFGGQILISEATFQAMAGASRNVNDWQTWPNRYIKSFEGEPQTVYELLWRPGQIPCEPGKRWLDLSAYREMLGKKVGTVRVFGEAEPRPLEKIFVELTVIEKENRHTHPGEWDGFQDYERRQQRGFVGGEEADRSGDPQEKREKTTPRRVKPDELLNRRTQAVIAGAPGCGKSTLMRYLAWQSLQKGERLPVFLELKTVSEQSFQQCGGNLTELLFEATIAAPLKLEDRDRERFREHFLERLDAGEAAVFLDGLDEVRGKSYFTDLCQSINGFVSSTHGKNSLFLSSRPYALYHQFEGMKEIEILGLRPPQIEQFLTHYYPGDPFVTTFRQQLKQRPELRELARVPFLLSAILFLYRRPGAQIDERMKLYKRIVETLVVQIDREKNVERFQIRDDGGLRRLWFLRQLAYERFFEDECETETDRLVFSTRDLLQKAQTCCESGVSSFQFVEDVKATALLREVGEDSYAFAHLTLQEYLAAEALAERKDCLEVFCRAYFRPAFAELEVLPMTLGLVKNPNPLYAAIESLPDTITFLNLRLRARGLAYVRALDEQPLNSLIQSLLDYMTPKSVEIEVVHKAVILSYAAMSAPFQKTILPHLSLLLQNADTDVRGRAVEALGKIGSEQAVPALLQALQSDDEHVRGRAVEALGQIGSEQAISALLQALQEADWGLRGHAIEVLGQIGSEQAVPALLQALQEADWVHRSSAVEALGKIGSEQAVPALLQALQDEERIVRGRAAGALGQIGSEQAVSALLQALQGDDKDANADVRRSAAYALGQIGSEQAIPALLQALQDADWGLRSSAAGALGQIGSEQAIPALLHTLKDAHQEVCSSAVEALGQIGSEQAVPALLQALQGDDEDANADVRRSAAYALGQIGSEQAIPALLQALQDADWGLRSSAVGALGQIGSEQAIPALLQTLKDGDEHVRGRAAMVLGQIGSEQVFPALLQALQSDDRELRSCAAIGLGHNGSEQAVPALLQALQGEDLGLRWNAVEALGQIGSEQSISALLQALKDVDSDFQWKAVEALVHIGSEQAVPALLQVLQGEDLGFRKSLGRMNPSVLKRGLERALQHEETFVRQKAAHYYEYYRRMEEG